MTKEELKLKVKSQDRTKAQFKSFEYKRLGYKITRVYDLFDNLVAFGYKLDGIVDEVYLNHFKEESFDFVYYN